MRAGGCTFQQGLTQEATSVVQQAVTLAKCRGHAQVTPLHVAKTLLSSSTGLFRTACLQSHSHPLQCKALELCFNVALNRLPACSNSSPMLGNHHYHLSNLQNNPSISNALVAAFKRAQAHQRRGSIENQQQPLLALKIELEQLIISILDDPSVSRVMREAGFSSTQVKVNVEQAVSLELCPSQITTTKTQQVIGTKVISTKPVVSDPIGVNEDISSLVQSLVNRKKKSIVVVGECVSSIEEQIVRGLMKKVEYKENLIPEGLREVKFITLVLSSFGQFSKAEVENEIGELKSAVRGNLGKGVVLYMGDLKWAIEYRASTNSSSEVEYERLGYYNYSPVEHMVMELGKMVFELNALSESCGRFWLLGIASFQTYMRCKSGHPSLETILGIHPLTVPSGSLRLSLVNTESELNSESMINKTSKNDNESMIVESGDNQIGSFVESSAKFEVEAKRLYNSTCKSDSTTNQLPAWLQQCKNEIRMHGANSIDQSCVQVSDLCKKWNSFGNSTTTHRQQSNFSSEKTQLKIITSVPASGFSYDQQNHQRWPIVEPTQSWKEQQHFWASEVSPNIKAIEPLRIYIPEHNEIPKQPFSSNPNSTPTSVSSSDLMEITDHYSNSFKHFSTEKFKTICEALEKKVPKQKHIIPEIVNTILKCRAGDIRRKGKVDNSDNQVMIKEETWLLFQGVDFEAKEKIARELGKLIFGNSQNNFVSITLSRFSSNCSGAESTEDCRVNKRCRDEQSCSYIERFADQVFENPHRVFLLEDIEEVDYCSQLGFKRAIERGKITTCNGEEIGFGDAIVILSCESFSSRSRACSPQEKTKLAEDHDSKEEISPCVTLDLNISFEDDENGDHEGQSIDEIGLIQCVDRRVIFKMQDL